MAVMTAEGTIYYAIVYVTELHFVVLYGREERKMLVDDIGNGARWQQRRGAEYFVSFCIVLSTT